MRREISCPITIRSKAKPHYSRNQSGYRSDTWPCFVSKAEIAENSEEPENEEENEKNSKSSSSTKFRLVGILVHSGQASGGHYYSYVLQRYISSPFFVILQYFTRRLPLKPTRTLTKMNPWCFDLYYFYLKALSHQRWIFNQHNFCSFVSDVSFRQPLIVVIVSLTQPLSGVL